MKVLVTGAAGFVGSHLCRALRDAEHKVVGLVSKLPTDDKREAEVEYAIGDVRDLDSLPPDAFADCGAVFHLVGIIAANPGKGETFEAIHVRGTANVVRAATRAGVPHFVYLSAQGADPKSPSEYARTKAAAERIVAQAETESTIYRPSIILGPNCAFAKQIEQLIRRPPLCPFPLPFIPVPGSGRNLFQPVWIDDLTRCLVRSIANDKTAEGTESASASETPESTVNSPEPLLPVLTGDKPSPEPTPIQSAARSHHSETFAIGGADAVSFNDLINGFAARLGKTKPLVHAPMPLMFAAASLLEAVLPHPPITVDQLLQLRVDNVCDNSAVEAAFGVKPIGFEEILARMYES